MNNDEYLKEVTYPLVKGVYDLFKTLDADQCKLFLEFVKTFTLTLNGKEDK